MTDDRKLAKRAIKNEFLNDDHSLRLVLLYEFSNRLIPRTNPHIDRLSYYQTFCSKAGYTPIDFIEFDFWFSRFQSGNFDLSVEKSEIPTGGLFNLMPLHIVEKIINKTNVEDMCRLRMVNRVFREIIDKKHIQIEKFELKIQNEIGWDSIDLKVDGRYFRPTTPDEEEEWDGFDKSKATKSELRPMLELLNHPNISFRMWEIVLIDEMQEETVDAIESLLKSFGHTFNVESVEIVGHQKSDYLKILPFLTPGILEVISLRSAESPQFEYWTIDGIDQTEQWKKARIAKIFFLTVNFDPENYAHFARFYVHSYISPESFLILKNKLLNSPVFEKGVIYLRRDNNFHWIYDYHAINRGLGRNRRFPIPGSDKMMEVEVKGGRNLRLEKV